jgi:hypothetical protein
LDFKSTISDSTIETKAKTSSTISIEQIKANGIFFVFSHLKEVCEKNKGRKKAIPLKDPSRGNLINSGRD